MMDPLFIMGDYLYKLKLSTILLIDNIKLFYINSAFKLNSITIRIFQLSHFFNNIIYTNFI